MQRRKNINRVIIDGAKKMQRDLRNAKKALVLADHLLTMARLDALPSYYSLVAYRKTFKKVMSRETRI